MQNFAYIINPWFLFRHRRRHLPSSRHEEDWSVGIGPRDAASNSNRARRNTTYTTYDDKNDKFDPNMTEYYFDTHLDHYNFRPTSPQKFKLRYFVNDQYYCYRECDAESPSPVILYAGNEAPIEHFIKNGGFFAQFQGADIFWLFTGICGATAVAFILISPRIKEKSYIGGQ